MTSFGVEPMADELERMLSALAAGTLGMLGAPTEAKHVDLKEEAGRRRGTTLLLSEPRNEQAAKALATELGSTDTGCRGPRSEVRSGG